MRLSPFSRGWNLPSSSRWRFSCLKSHSASLLIFLSPRLLPLRSRETKGPRRPGTRGHRAPLAPLHRSGWGRRARLPSPRGRGWARPLTPHPGRAAWTPAGSHSTVTAPSPAAPLRPGPSPAPRWRRRVPAHGFCCPARSDPRR